MDISQKNRQVNNISHGQLIRLENEIYKFIIVKRFVRNKPVEFQCENIFTKKPVTIDILDMKHAAEFISEDSPSYKSIMVLYGSKEG